MFGKSLISYLLVLGILVTSHARGQAASEGVTFPDPALEAAIRKALVKADGPLLAEDLAGLTKLSIFNSALHDLTGLERCTALTSIQFFGNEIVNIEALAELLQLEHALLSRNRIVDISPLRDLPKLSQLHLEGNPITDLAPLAGHTSLRYLDLGGLAITDPSVVATLTGLEQLLLTAMDLTDLGFVAPLTKLKELQANRNQITSLEPLRNLTELVDLYLDDNAITELSPLSGLELRRLYIRRNQLSGLAGFPKLREESTVLLGENRLTDIRSIVEALGNAGVAEVELGANQLGSDAFCRDIPALEMRGSQVYFKLDEPKEQSTRFPESSLICAATAQDDGGLILAAVNQGATRQQLEERFGALPESSEIVATAVEVVPAPENPSAALAVTLADTNLDVSVSTTGMDLKSLLGAIVFLAVAVFLVLVWRIPRRL